MWEWSDKLKLGKSSAFVKRDIASLPLTEAEFEADFLLDPEFSTKRKEAWVGLVIDRKDGAVLAMEVVQVPPPTVNCLATLLAHAMLRPMTGNRQRPRMIHLRNRPQWQELVAHLRQLGIEVFRSDDLSRFDKGVIKWFRSTKKKPLSADEIKTSLRKPFPERKRTWFTDAMELMEWSDAMCKRAYPSRKVPVPLYDPTTVVSIRLTADELTAIVTKTDIAKTKKLRPRLEATAAEGKVTDLDVHDWSDVLSALCGSRVEGESARRELLGLARRIANQLAEALRIDGPPSPVK